MTYRKKLIEVALPLEAINMESAREKSIRHGHPSTLHLWWARRPLAACRAVLFASLVDDPSSHPDKFPTEEAQNAERQRLFDILGRITIETDKKGNTKQVIRGLVSWDDINDPSSGVLEAAQREIARSIAWNLGDEPPTEPEAIRQYLAKNAPPVYDPFAGGGSIPLEAQRLGLEAHASDLNPVAVLINKALIEIPPKFKDMPPVNPEAQQKLNLSQWKGAQGLAEDVRYYGKWMRDEAEKRIGHLYPKVKLPPEKGGGEASVIAWFWARTVKCSNPACKCQIPLARSFALSKRNGRESWVKPVVSRQGKTPTISFVIENHQDDRFPSGTMSRKGAVCPCCDSPVSLEYLRSEGRSKRIGVQLMAIAAEGRNGRVYLEPNDEHEKLAKQTNPKWLPETELSVHPQYMGTPRYGLTKHCDLFTARQLTFLSEVASLTTEVKDRIIADYSINTSQSKRLNIQNYANSVLTYLGFCLSNLLDDDVTLCTWRATHGTGATGHAFARQAISMTWDFPEANPFANAAGDLSRSVEAVAKCIEAFPNVFLPGSISQVDATNDLFPIEKSPVISTDPPYYDAVPYADLSDFFYVWLRHVLKDVYPDIFKTVLVPKNQELVADEFRLGGNEKAKTFFEEGLRKVFLKIRDSSEINYPFTVYYAFKQTESDIDLDLDIQRQQDLFASTGWETMLEGLITSGFSVVGTLPVRTERSARSRSIGFNALASSIVLVCRPRPENAPSTTRRRFVDELKSELPDALKKLQQGNIAPVDLAQASIGPGMAVFSRYAKVLESDGSSMRVRTALQLINQTLDEFLAEQEGEFDTDTRWALAWFEQHQFSEGLFGDAETLSKAKNTSIKGMVDAGILTAKAGKVQLVPRDTLPATWNPTQDTRTPVWEATQQLIRTLDQQGEMGAARLLSQLGKLGEAARDLAYRLYSICDRKGWTQEAIAYNSLVISWAEIARLAIEQQQQPTTPIQTELGI